MLNIKQLSDICNLTFCKGSFIFTSQEQTKEEEKMKQKCCTWKIRNYVQWHTGSTH